MQMIFAALFHLLEIHAIGYIAALNLALPVHAEIDQFQNRFRIHHGHFFGHFLGDIRHLRPVSF